MNLQHARFLHGGSVPAMNLVAPGCIRGEPCVYQGKYHKHKDSQGVQKRLLGLIFAAGCLSISISPTD
jgi:hypothetical protein